MVVEIAGSVAVGAGVVAAPDVPEEDVELPVPLDEPELPDEDPVPPLPVVLPVVPPVVPPVGVEGVLAATAAQPVPGLMPVRTFDQTMVLSLNERLVPSSNS